MSSEHPDRQTTRDTEASQAVSIPWWAVIVAALFVFVPVLIMSLTMLMMGLVGPPIQGWMAPSDPGILVVVGTFPLILVIGVFNGLSRLFVADTK